MAINNLFTYYASFNEFLPVYRDVIRVWVGNGSTTGTAGMLYAEYQDGTYAEIGSVSLYETAVASGFTGTPQQWVQAIMNMANLVRGSDISVYYKISEDGQNHPPANDEWSNVPVSEQGKYTWVKMNLTWVDGSTTPIYFCAYNGLDGSVTSVNQQTGDIFLHGENLLIAMNSQKTIKQYIDENDIPNIATNDDIDAMFSNALFSGAVFITGRRFEAGDSITLKIEAVTPGAPLPLETTTTINPTGGNSWHFGFDTIAYNMNDIPTGQTTRTYQYKIKELSHTISGVDIDTTEYIVGITLTDMGNGTLRIEKTSNYNSLYFSHSYASLGRITFQGTITLNGRSMAAREFMVQIKEGNEVIADNISTSLAAATGQPAFIVFPPINYTLADVGTHTYTIRETSPSGDGVTVSSQVYTVDVVVTDVIKDGALEIDVESTGFNLDFVNTYAAQGSVTLTGTKTLVHRLFRDTDTYSVSIAGNGKLPSPATVSVTPDVGEASVDFAFPTINYSLVDMQNAISGYDDIKLFTYTVTETANIPGVTPDGITHTVVVKLTDNKHGQLIPEVTYSDSGKVRFTGTYNATGTIIINGSKVLQNRRFVATDTMSVSLRSTNNGKLPYISDMTVLLTAGQSSVDFHFIELAFSLSDIDYLATKTFSYVCEESTVITGATNDVNVHTLDIVVSDNYDGTLSVTPTYSDGNRFIFTSVYSAVGYLALTGTKTLLNRNFRSGDTLSVEITSNNGGNLPNPATISVPLTTNTNIANFNFAQIVYNITDLNGQSSAVFNYTATETCSMAGASASSTTDSITVTVTDNTDGTLNVVPTYTSNNKINFTNVYSATGNLSFKVREIMTNGSLSVQPITVRVRQVVGNNSQVQATNNVVLGSAVTVVANTNSSTDVDFTNVVSFVKNSSKDDTQNTYWFMIDQVNPTLDANNVNNNVHYDTSKKWINVSVSDNGDGTLTITKTPAADASTNLDATFTNEQLGTLVITNTWAGDYNRLTTAQKNAITFVVSGPSGYSSSFTYADMVNNSKSIDSLELGEYTVTETNNTIENFTVTPSFSVNNVSTNQVTLTDGTSKTVAVTNNINKLEGSLTITNVWAGDHAQLTTAQKNAITFTVTGPKQNTSDVSTYSHSFTYADMVNDSLTISQLTLGTYTIIESNNGFDNFNISTSFSVNGTAINSAIIGDGDNKTIVVTNNVNKLEGDLVISQVWSGDHARLTTAQKNGLTYTVTGPKQNVTDANTYSRTFTYADMTSDSFTITGLTLGSYAVSVSNNSFDNFNVTTTYAVNNTSSNSVAIADGETKTIEVTCAINKLEGSLTIEQTWLGDYQGLTTAQKNGFTYTVTGPKQYPSDATTYSYVFTYQDMTNDSLTIDNLSLGTYTVIISNTTIENYVITNSYEVDSTSINSVTIADGDSKTIEITSDVDRIEGSITVTKIFDGDANQLTASDKNGITFMITGPKQVSTDPSIYSYAFTYEDMVNDSKTIDHLTPGTYTVTEMNTNVTGFTVSTVYEVDGSATNSITIADGDSKTIEITNTYTQSAGE